jgi:hypothetical protein
MKNTTRSRRTALAIGAGVLVALGSTAALAAPSTTTGTPQTQDRPAARAAAKTSGGMAAAAPADASDITPGIYSIKSVAWLTRVMTAPTSGNQVVGWRESEIKSQ